MIVVSDTSALVLLSQLNQLSVLHVLYGTVFIPPEVHRELIQHFTKMNVPNLLATTSMWLHVQTPQSALHHAGLHPGEIAAIALAKELKADFLIIDEKAGRKVAVQEQVPIIGTIGVLEKAADAGLLDLAKACNQLKQFRFFVAQELLDARLKVFELRQALKPEAKGPKLPQPPKRRDDRQP